MREFHEIRHTGDQGINQNECCKWWIDPRIGIDVTGFIYEIMEAVLIMIASSSPRKETEVE
jgi:hypothetical protein